MHQNAEPELQLKPEETAIIPIVTEDEYDRKSANLDLDNETNDSCDLITETRCENNDSYNSSEQFDKSEGNYQVKRTRKIYESNKQFSCNICNKRFSQKRNLATHIKIHDEMYTQDLKCEICGKMFASKTIKNTHMKSAHAGIIYQCPKCGITNKWKCKILQHIGKNHKGENVGSAIEKIPK